MSGDMYADRIRALLQLMQATKIVKEDNLPSKIEEGLYLGSLGAANNKSELKRLNVTHILTVATSLAPAHPNDFEYKIIPVYDREDVPISNYFDECFAFIDEARKAGGGVLVHCFAGRSRSVSVILAYMMFKSGMSLSDALKDVTTKRPVAGPNSGFISQLKEFEKSIQGSKTKKTLEVLKSSA